MFFLESEPPVLTHNNSGNYTVYVFGGAHNIVTVGDLDSAAIDDLDSKIEVVELSDQNKTDLEKSLDLRFVREQR